MRPAPPRCTRPVSASSYSPSGSAIRDSPQYAPTGAAASPSLRANRRGASATTMSLPALSENAMSCSS